MKEGSRDGYISILFIIILLSIPLLFISVPKLITGYVFNTGYTIEEFDAHGLENKGIVNGALLISDNTKIGDAYSFDGDDDYIDISNQIPSYGEEFSFDGWVYIEDTTTDPCVICKAEWYDLDFSIGYYTYLNRFSASVSHSGEQQDEIAAFSKNAMDENKWYHFAVVKTKDDLTVYIDGEKGTSIAAAFTVTNNPDVPIHIGQKVDAHYHLKGKVDHLIFYDYALSEQEIINHYNLDYGDIEEEGCVETWQCTEWSACSNNQQTRTCSDSSTCGTDVNKPLEQQSCIQNVTCVEDWTCIDWSDCSDKIHIRICVDNNNCGTEISKPQLQTPCGNETCTELWKCSDWNECTNNLQIRTCSDQNNCGTELEKPVRKKQCVEICEEEWKCAEWSNCDKGKQIRSCFDSNDCNTEKNKPNQEKSCEQTCEEDWSCSGWDECYEGVQRRECTDSNYCGTQLKRPLHQRDCECVLEKAYWTKTEANNHEIVELVLESHNCKGQTTNIDIIETDGVFGSKSVEKKNVVINNDKLSVKWKAIWEDDNILPFIEGNPEYIFTASVNPDITSENALIVTNEPAAPALPTDWPQFQYDAQHTGRTNVEVPPDYEVAWAWVDKNHIVQNFVSAPGNNITDGFEQDFKFTVIFSEQVQPIIADGRTFFGAMNGVMYAVDSLTGNNIWDSASEGSILSTAAYFNNILIFTSMDGKIYGLNADTGYLVWSYKTGAGINSAPVVQDDTVYVGSRDGKFYAIDANTGNLRWSYETRIPGQPNSVFKKAPIVAPAAVSKDGSKVFFGAENMYFYALNTADGSEVWIPKKLVGQSFLYTWPVVKDNVVITYVISSLIGAEEESTGMEQVLDSISANPTWQEERDAILNFLQQNAYQKIIYVFDVNTGQEPYQVAMGRVTGTNYPPHSPVIDNQDRLLTYWRSKHSTLFNDQGTFGSIYCPDVSEMDVNTGDRITLNIPAVGKISCPELDNGFQPTVGGDWLYLHNHFRGAKVINLVTGISRGITGTLACNDGAGWRGGNCNGCWGYQIIYYGNDNDPRGCGGLNYEGVVPPVIYNPASGFTGITIAETSGQSMLYINEGNSHAIVAVRQST